MTYAALDVGGTKIVGALFGDGEPSTRIEVVTPLDDGRADPGAAATLEVLAALAQAAGGRLEGVGVSVCEYVDAGRLTSREVLAWPPGQQWLERALGPVPLVVESDVRCGALAELALGALRDVATGYYVSWGTGIAGCLVHTGRVVEGTHGRAIALGELVVDGERLESYASGRAITDRYHRGTGTVVAGAREVLLLAGDGDVVAQRIVRSAGVALADALATVVRLLDPGVVVLGGGLGGAETLASEAMRDRVGAHVADGLPPTRVVRGGLGADGPLVGAALAAGWRGPDGRAAIG